MASARVLTDYTDDANVFDVLVPYYETVGFELFDPETPVPEGGTEELVWMTDGQD